MATRDRDSWGERSIPDGVTHSSDSAESVLRPFLGAAFLVAACVLTTKLRVLGDYHPSSHQTPALASDISAARGRRGQEHRLCRHTRDPRGDTATSSSCVTPSPLSESSITGLQIQLRASWAQTSHHRDIAGLGVREIIPERGYPRGGGQSLRQMNVLDDSKLTSLTGNKKELHLVLFI